MLSLELWQLASQFVESRLTIEQLEDWLVPRLPAIMQSPDSADADFAAVIELGLAEMSDGMLDDAQLREELAREMKKHQSVATIYPSMPVAQVTATSSSSISGIEWPAQWVITPTSLAPTR